MVGESPYPAGGPIWSHTPVMVRTAEGPVDKLPWWPWWALLFNGPPVSCVALGQSVHLPGPQWPHLSRRPGE